MLLKKIVEYVGDLVCSRDITAGGNVRVEGDVAMHGNLKVHGRLSAPNISTPCLGLFADRQQLETLFPHPRNGEWALVGDGIPARVFRAFAREWYDTGESGGTPVIDAPLYDRRIADLRQEFESFVSQVEQQFDTLYAATAEGIDAELLTQLRTLLDATRDIVSANREYITQLFSELSQTRSSLDAAIADLTVMVGRCETETAKLPPLVADAVEVAEEAAAAAARAAQVSFLPFHGYDDERFPFWQVGDTAPVEVRWNEQMACFVALDELGVWCTKWPGSDDYQSYYQDEDGNWHPRPHACMLYLNTLSKSLCVFIDGSLTEL